MSSIYESVSYTKDFLTGTTDNKIKKKRDLGIKGKVTLSLFDAKTNKKLKESYTENLIPDLYFKDVFLSQFLNGIMGVGDSRYGKNYTWFNYIYLTDSDKPESANDQRVMGNVIGYADRNIPYSGDDTLKGTINLSETKFEVTGDKIRCNFVFDFPTHAANGVTESIYFCEAEPYKKDYFYTGAPIYARESGDNNCTIVPSVNPRRYYGVCCGFQSSTTVNFFTKTTGYFLINANSSTFTQSAYLQFPDNLKGHFVYMPFDVNTNDCMLWDNAVKLLNSDGGPLAIISSDPIKKYDGLNYVCPYKNGETDVIIGYYVYSVYLSGYYHYFMRIYKWSKVGVLQSFVDMDLSEALKDEYGSIFNYTGICGDGIFLDGCISIVGYNKRVIEGTSEYIYTSRWIKISADGSIVQNLDIKPKIGNCTWFGAKGMNSQNIEQKCYANKIYLSNSLAYISYTGIQGGTSFWQCVNHTGNLIEPQRQYFFCEDSFSIPYNILGTDRYLIRLGQSYSSCYRFMLSNALTSRPVGTHTCLSQPVEKTDANTMKVQYMFEIDMPVYGEDYY